MKDLVLDLPTIVERRRRPPAFFDSFKRRLALVGLRRRRRVGCVNALAAASRAAAT